MEAKPLLTPDIRSTAIDQLYGLYPQLADDKSIEWLNILNTAQVMDGPEDAMLATVGSSCANFMLLLDGTIRIYQDTEDGKELTLYRISPGDVQRDAGRDERGVRAASKTRDASFVGGLPAFSAKEPGGTARGVET